MKQIITICAILLLLTTIVAAQANITGNTTLPKIDPKDPTPKLDDKLEKDIIVPESLEPFINLIFGIKNKLSFSTFILLILLLLGIFLVVYDMLGFMEMFKGWTKIVGAIVITLLISISGVVRFVAETLLDVGEKIKFIEQWTAGKLGLIIIVIILGAILLKKVSKFWHEKQEFARAKGRGSNAGLGLAMLETTAESAKELKK